MTLLLAGFKSKRAVHRPPDGVGGDPDSSNAVWRVATSQALVLVLLQTLSCISHGLATDAQTVY